MFCLKGDFGAAPSPFSGIVPLLAEGFVVLGLLFVGTFVLVVGFKLAKKLNGDDVVLVVLNPANEPNAPLFAAS